MEMGTLSIASGGLIAGKIFQIYKPFCSHKYTKDNEFSKIL